MPFLRTFAILLAVPVLLVACGDEEPEDDSCRGITCPAGFDCRAGACVERPDTEPKPTGCQVNADCFQDPAGSFCDRGSGACVACQNDSQCAGRSCSAGACVGPVCSSDDACSDPTPFCNAKGDACVACLVNESCTAGEACENGACVELPIECASDAECAEAAPARPRCVVNDGRGLCVECRRSSDCEAGVDCLGGSCVDVRCEDEADCAAFPDLPLCGEAGRCIGCTDDDDCQGGQLCVDDRCEAAFHCTTDADCAGHAGGENCDTSTGACVICANDRDCAAGERCEGASACVPIVCADVGDCPRGMRCEDERCAAPPPCESSTDCSFDPRAPQCNGAGACVACVADSHCSGAERCIAESCVVPQECVTDSQCKGGFVCNGGLCNACRSDDQCARGVCSAGACVDAAACTDDRACAVGVCAAGSCAACATTLDCAPGLWCEAGSCMPSPSCAAAIDCGPGSVCTAGSCVPATCDPASLQAPSPARAIPIGAGMPTTFTICNNEERWFVLGAAQGAGLSAELLAPPAGTTLALAWYEPGSRAMKIREGIGGKVVAGSLPQAAVGRYYLRVRSTAGLGGSTGLLVSTTAGGGLCTDALEPNDRHDAPRPIVAGRWLEGLLLCGDDDFYSVQVPSGQPLQVFAFPEANGEAVLQIYDTGGTRLASGTNIPFLGGGKAALVAAAAGERTLLVRVAATAPVARPYSLFVTTERDPACSVAPPLIGARERARIGSATLGSNADQTPGACGGGGPDRAWNVRLNQPQRFLAEVRAPFPVRLSLRNASCSAEHGCGAALASGEAILDIARLPAGDYTLVVGGAPGGAGPFELAARTLPALPAPANDLCVDAAPLNLAGGFAAASGSTHGAGSEGGASCGPGSPEVYYRFHVGQPGRLVVDLEADGAASLALLEGPVCGPERACVGPARQGRIDRQVNAGDWTVAVAASSAVGFRITAALPAPVANDTCLQATPLPIPGSVSGDTTWAADDLSYPLHQSCTGYFTAGQDAFHGIVLAAGQTIEATLTPAQGYDAALYLIGGCGAPQCLAGVDAAFDGGPETLRFTAPAPGPYRLVVDGASGGGAYTLQVR